jgi:hypothetical protein
MWISLHGECYRVARTTNGLRMLRHALLALLAFVIAMSAPNPGSPTLPHPSAAADSIFEKARPIYDKVITLDTHIDFSPATSEIPRSGNSVQPTKDDRSLAKNAAIICTSRFYNGLSARRW